MQNTSNNLNTFRILYLIKGILTLCFSLFFILYGLFGYFFSESIEFSDSTDGMPFSLDVLIFSSIGLIMMVISAIGIFLSIILGTLTLLASKYIKDLKNYNFIFAIAIVNCLTGVLGILLGVFTLVELTKPEIKQLFNKV
ncbi:hypothetical protein [Algibacter sp. 2305UL17-15]|uniref:hypothetical protein n=1 Tax=Algibacter sp. 2305UL17-15 TaxID=3231268 RepID=UPI003458F648